MVHWRFVYFSSFELDPFFMPRSIPKFDIDFLDLKDSYSADFLVNKYVARLGASWNSFLFLLEPLIQFNTNTSTPNFNTFTPHNPFG